MSNRNSRVSEDGGPAEDRVFFFYSGESSDINVDTWFYIVASLTDIDCKEAVNGDWLSSLAPMGDRKNIVELFQRRVCGMKCRKHFFENCATQFTAIK